MHRLPLHTMNEDIVRIVWVPGTENTSDALKKPLYGVKSAIIEEMIAWEQLVNDVEDLRGIGVSKIEEI